MAAPSDIKWIRNLESAIHWFGHFALTNENKVSYAGYVNRKVFATCAIGWFLGRLGYGVATGHKIDIKTLAGQSLLAGVIGIPVSRIPRAGENQGVPEVPPTPPQNLSWHLYEWFRQTDPGWRPEGWNAHAR